VPAFRVVPVIFISATVPYLSFPRIFVDACKGVKAVFGHIPNGIPSPQPDPLWDGSVLLLRFRQLLLGAEGFVRLLLLYYRQSEVW
jgi:hypothetical protein